MWSEKDVVRGVFEVKGKCHKGTMSWRSWFPSAGVVHSNIDGDGWG